MADDLPDAPWAGSGNSLPDAPWAEPEAPRNDLLGMAAMVAAPVNPGFALHAAMTPAGRAGLYDAAIKPYFDLLGSVKKAVTGQASSDEETDLAGNIGLMFMGAGADFAKAIPEVAKAAAPVAKAFTDGVAAPAAVRMDAYARTGDPNGVRLEPPTPETQPAPIRPIEGSPFAGVPRSVAARTGVPHVDAVLDSPVTKSVIDNPVVDRSHDVPYMAGASDPINNPTVFVDRHVPTEQKISGVTFDPADPWIVHENVEQHTMELLTKGGMDDQTAYKVAHYDFAEQAEQAWYRAHGIDQVAAEKEQATWLPKIQGENTGGDVPQSLYKKPYPHDAVPNVDHESLIEPRPTPEESARGAQIVRDWAAKQTTSAVPMLQEARELGVIGRDENAQTINELSPREAGQRVMAATRAPDDKLTMEPQDQQSAWRQRWEQTLDKMATRDDVRRVINGIVDANDEFALARQGDMRPVQIEQLADVTGLDSRKIDVAGTSAKIKTDVEMRNITEAYRTVNDKIRDAAAAGDAEKFTEAELQRDLLLDSTVATKGLVALRAEFGRAGNRLQEFYKAQREAAGMKDFLGGLGRTEEDVRDRMRMIADTPPSALPKVLEQIRGKQQGWVFWNWTQGLISGIPTHLKYGEVNLATAELERVVVPEVAAIIGRMRGDKTSLTAPLWANVGMIKGVPDAFRGAVAAFKSGQRVPLESELALAERGLKNPETKGATTPYDQAAGPDWGIWKKVFNEDQLAAATKVLGVPGRNANAIHTFYKLLSERGSAELHAMQAAFEEGKTGDEFNQRYQYYKDNPSDEALQQIVTDAYTGTFMQKLGDKIGSLSRALKDNPVTKWLFPFQHIPWNIERMTMAYEPFALLDTITGYTQTGRALRGDLGKSAQNIALGRVVVGTTIASYFVNKALSGQATGDYPLDPKERRRWALLNTQPNSVQIGDEWYSTTRLGPVGNLARIGANLGEIVHNYNNQDDNAVMKAFGAFGLAIINQLADETGFETTRNFIDIMEGRQNVTKFLAWQAGSFLPMSSFISQGASIMDPDMRVADGFIQGLRYRIPFAREGLLPKRDPLFGEPVHNPGYHTILRENPTALDPVKRELDRIGYYPMPPRKTIGGVKLDDAQYDRYEATAGPLVKQLLSAAISSQRYQSLPPNAQRAMVKGYIAYGRARARQALHLDQPHLVRQGIDQRQQAILGH